MPFQFELVPPTPTSFDLATALRLNDAETTYYDYILDEIENNYAIGNFIGPILYF